MADDPFSLLGAPVRFDLDLEAVRAAWLARVAQSHPDRAGAAASDPEAARTAARLNDALREIADPESRANALLRRLGGPSKEQDHSLPAGFLVEMMEVREELESALQGGDAPAQARWEAWASEQRAARLAAVARHFAKAQQTDPPDPGALRAVRTELNAWRYIERMLEQLSDRAG